MKKTFTIIATTLLLVGCSTTTMSPVIGRVRIITNHATGIPIWHPVDNLKNKSWEQIASIPGTTHLQYYEDYPAYGIDSVFFEFIKVSKGKKYYWLHISEINNLPSKLLLPGVREQFRETVIEKKGVELGMNAREIVLSSGRPNSISVMLAKDTTQQVWYYNKMGIRFTNDIVDRIYYSDIPTYWPYMLPQEALKNRQNRLPSNR